MKTDYGSMGLRELGTVVVYPNIVARLGGVQWVTLTARLAKVKLPGREEIVRMPRRLVPKNFTGFTLAETCQAWLEGKLK